MFHFMFITNNYHIFCPQKSTHNPWNKFSMLEELEAGYMAFILSLTRELKWNQQNWITCLCLLMDRHQKSTDVRDVAKCTNGNKDSVIMFDSNVAKLLSFTALFVLTKHIGKRILSGTALCCIKWIHTWNSGTIFTVQIYVNWKYVVESPNDILTGYSLITFYILYNFWGFNTEDFSGYVPLFCDIL